MNEPTVSDPILDLLEAHAARQRRLVAALRESFTETELMAIEVAVDGEYRDMPYQKRLRQAAHQAHAAAQAATDADYSTTDRTAA